MKLGNRHTSVKMLSEGVRRVTLDLRPDEKVLVIRQEAHYRLADPVSDVIHARHLNEAEEVTWCAVEQAWVA